MPDGEPPVIPVPPGPVDPPPAADAAPPEVVAAPSVGLPVPPGAPPGYRGYGVTAPPAVSPAERPTDSAPPAVSPFEPPPAFVPGPAPEPSGVTDSVTVAASGAPAEEPRDWLLRLPDGRGLPVDQMLLLGRNPDPALGPPGARTVSLDDPARTVSRTHLVVGPSGPGELLARNVSTVNALVVTAADGVEFKIQPGGSVVLVDAARVLVGAYPIALEPV
ncbi:MAG TPA: hypothetical protein VNQ48_03845 [Microbacteriaceae bacterium]|nr:hypothetical protein [Microbacteriaceae bacterium]